MSVDNSQPAVPFSNNTISLTAVAGSQYTFEVERSAPNRTFSLVPPIVEGMTIDASSGKCEWKVPMEYSEQKVPFKVSISEAGSKTQPTVIEYSLTVQRPPLSRKLPLFDVLWERSSSQFEFDLALELSEPQVEPYLKSQGTKGFRPAMISGYETIEGERQFSVTTVNDNTSHLLCFDQSSSEFQRFVNRLSPNDYCPAWIDGYGDGGEYRVSSIGIPITDSWQARSLGISRLSEELTSWNNSGWSVAQLTVEDDERRVRVLFLSTKKIGTTTYKTEMSAEEIRTWIAQHKQQGRISWIAPYWRRRDGVDSRLYSVVFTAPSALIQWDLDLQLLPHELKRMLPERAKLGYVPAVIQVR